jgi:circadian clock protein KaiC
VDRLGSGIAALDSVLGGGLPCGSLVILAGSPGTGKTILAQQIAFANATPEGKALYYTTLSEPHTKLVEHLEQFGFFEPAALERRVEFIHLSDLMNEAHEDGLAEVVSEIIQSSFEHHPSVVVIDSAKALRDSSQEPGFREVVYRLASSVAHTRAVLLMVGEYTVDDMKEGSEFAVADGIVQLANERNGPVNQRWMRVVKMRGADHLEGEHGFSISDAGVQVFPRIEVTIPHKLPRFEGRVSTGARGLDEMMGGGIPRGDLTVLQGPAGVGKTVLALQFIASGLAEGERCLYVSLQEGDAQLAKKAEAFGWDLGAARESGLLSICHIPPVEIDLDEVSVAICSELQRGVRRVVLDGFAELAFAARQTERLPAYAWSLGRHMRAAGATSVVINETAALEAGAQLAFLFHNVIDLRYIQLESELHRAASIMKMRDSDHDKGFVRFEITEGGFTILNKLADLTELGHHRGPRLTV